MIVLSITTTILSSIIAFLIVLLLLVGILLFVKAKLSPTGKIKILINGEKELEVDGGNTLLTTLGDALVFFYLQHVEVEEHIQCTCQVHSGGGGILLLKSLILVEKNCTKLAIRLPGKSKRGYGSSNTRGGFWS